MLRKTIRRAAAAFLAAAIAITAMPQEIAASAVVAMPQETAASAVAAMPMGASASIPQMNLDWNARGDDSWKQDSVYGNVLENLAESFAWAGYNDGDTANGGLGV